MLDGKMLRAATGTPIRKITLANRPLALAEPEPFTLANLTTKSFVAVSGFDMSAVYAFLAEAEVLRDRRHTGFSRANEPPAPPAPQGQLALAGLATAGRRAPLSTR